MQVLRSTDSPISYTTARDSFLAAIESVGLKKELYGLHSLRSGGASAAANAGIPDRVFKRHGRWSLEKAKDGYVKDKLAVLLLVSSSLGL